MPDTGSPHKITPRKRPPDDDEMDITPMIDITFLLLIFFLVASKMEPSADIQLPPAVYGEGVGERNSVFITVKRDGEQARIFKGDTTDTGSMFKGDPVQQEEAITEFVQQELEKSPEKHFAIIKGEGNVKHGDIARIAKAIGKAEAVEGLYVAVLQNQ